MREKIARKLANYLEKKAKKDVSNPKSFMGAKPVPEELKQRTHS